MRRLGAGGARRGGLRLVPDAHLGAPQERVRGSACRAQEVKEAVTPEETICLFNGKDLGSFYTWLDGPHGLFLGAALGLPLLREADSQVDTGKAPQPVFVWEAMATPNGRAILRAKVPGGWLVAGDPGPGSG